MPTMEVWTVEEVAERLKVSMMTVYRWCKTGQLPATKIGHQWRVTDEDLEAFIRTGTRAS